MSFQDFVGRWNLKDSVGFDDYLKEAGVNFMTRKIASNLKPTLDFEVNGNHWKMTSTSTFKTIVIEFDLDQEFEETTGDGRKMLVNNLNFIIRGINFFYLIMI